MPLKKLPPEMSYAALREAHPPKESEREPAARTSKRHEANSAEKPAAPVRQTGPAEAPETDKSKPARVKEGRAVSDDPEPRSVGQDSQQPSTSEPAPQKAAASTPRPRTLSAPGKAARSEQVNLRGYVQIPVEGAFDVFDELAALYGERKALSLALTASLKDYGKAVSEGKTLPVPSDYTSLTSIEAARTLPVATVEAARAHLDPRGLLGAYQLGGLIFKAALGRYLAKG